MALNFDKLRNDLRKDSTPDETYSWENMEEGIFHKINQKHHLEKLKAENIWYKKLNVILFGLLTIGSAFMLFNYIIEQSSTKSEDKSSSAQAVLQKEKKYVDPIVASQEYDKQGLNTGDFDQKNNALPTIIKSDSNITSSIQKFNGQISTISNSNNILQKSDEANSASIPTNIHSNNRIRMNKSQKNNAIEYTNYYNAKSNHHAGSTRDVAQQNIFEGGIDHLINSDISQSVDVNGYFIEEQKSKFDDNSHETNSIHATQGNNHIIDASAINAKKIEFDDVLNTLPPRINHFPFSKRMAIPELKMELMPISTKQIILHEVPHFFMNVSLGMNIHRDLLGLHKPEQGYNAIYRIGMQKNKLSLSTGIEFSILVEQFDYKKDKTVFIANALTNQYVNVLTNDTTSVYGQANASVTRTVVHHNQYRYLDVPIMVNYELIKHNKVRFGIGLGLSLSRLVSQSGRYNLNDNVQNFDNTNGFLKNSLEMHFKGELYTNYIINDRLYLISRLNVTTIRTKRNTDQTSVNSILGSGTLGVGYRF